MTENDRKWTPKQEKFIDWMTYTKSDRVPKTQGELAKELGLNEVTLTRWKKLPGFWDVVKSRVRSRLDEHYADIYGALVSEAKKGSFQHIDKYMSMMGDDPRLGEKENPLNILISYDDDNPDPA